MKQVILLLLILSLTMTTFAGLLTEPAKPGSDYNTVPAFPTQTTTQTCHLDLSNELFGGVRAACSHTLDRSRCCPVLAAWLFAAHARSALQINTSSNPVQQTGPDIQPMMPDDSQKCVDSLQESLVGRDIRIPQPNGSCDAVLCFCGIRLHQITSLSCPAAFNLSTNGTGGIAKPSLAVKNLEKNCRNSTYAGCTKCLGALQKVNGEGKNGTKHVVGEDRASKMMVRDCQLMGLTWLLARNKTAHIPTVSAVLRAIMYSAHPPHQSTCSPDQENMPLAVDSLQFETNSSPKAVFATVCLQLLSLIILWHLY